VRVMAVASPDICGCRLDDSPFQTMYRALLRCGPDGDCDGNLAASLYDSPYIRNAV
jgi:hypothetical protein